MNYIGRTTEIGASFVSARQRRPFTRIESGYSGHLIEGGMVGTAPGADMGGQIPFMNAQALGIDVPPLAFTLPVAIVGNKPPGSTLPTTMPTDPKYYGGKLEGQLNLQPELVYGNGAQPAGPVVGKLAKPDPQYYGNGIDTTIPDDPAPFTGRGTAEKWAKMDAAAAQTKALAKAAQDKADEERRKKNLYWLVIGGAVAAYFLFFRGK